MTRDNRTYKDNSLIKQSDNDLSFSLLKTDTAFIKVYKKTEKIVTATYLLTGHFLENEPLKWSLRERANQMLVLVSGMKGKREVRTEVKEKMFLELAEMTTFFDVARLASMVSENNFNLLKTEFFNLSNLINEYASSGVESSVLLDRNFFEVKDIPVEPKDFNSNTKRHSKGHDVDKGQNVQDTIEKTDRQTHKVIRETNIPEKKIPEFYEVKTPSDMRKTNRRNLILNSIKKKGGVMIKDLVPIVKGCSEKTIQRELATLISSGIIKKEGERRWSVYKMA